MQTLTLFLLSFAIATQFASAATITGSTQGDPTWRRPIVNGNGNGNGNFHTLSSTGTAVAYDVIHFTVSGSGNYSFQETAADNWNNYTFLYSTSFDPTNQLTNGVAGNDDNPSIGSSGFTAHLSSAVQYYFVSTGFGNQDFGSFNLSISGPGSINFASSILASSDSATVPEPSTIALGGIGLLLLLLVNRSSAC